MAKYNSQNLNQKKQSLTTRMKWGISLFVISFVLFLLVVINFIVPIHNFILGTFGLCVYPILIISMAVGVLLMLKKQYRIAKVYIATIITAFFLLVMFFQLVLTDLSVDFGEYISNCYYSRNTAGGVIIGILTYALNLGLGLWGVIILEVIALVICAAFIIDYFLKMKEYKEVSTRTLAFSQKESKKLKVKKAKEQAEEAVKEPEPKLVLDAYVEKKEQAKQALFSKTSYKNEDDMAIQIFGEEFVNNMKNQNSPKQKNEKKEFTLAELYEENKGKENMFITREAEAGKPSRFIHNEEKTAFQTTLDLDNLKSFENFRKREQEERRKASDNMILQNNFANQNANNFIRNENSQQNNNFSHQRSTNGQSSTNGINNGINASINNSNFNSQSQNNSVQNQSQQNNALNEENDVNDLNVLNLDDSEISEIIAPKEEVKKPEPINKPPRQEFNIPSSKPQHENKTEPPKRKLPKMPYIRPPIDLLTTKSTNYNDDNESYNTKALLLEETLDSFKIPAKVVAITRGPAVTRYELQMPSGIPVKKIVQHSEDIAMMMKNKSIRVETPIPGKSLVGVEVPNDTIATIGLKDIIDTEMFLNNKHALSFALGKDIVGDCKICNLEQMPHLLVAGSTGSGKSVCLNVILISLLYRLGPNDLKILLIDPKRVEFVSYNYLPHMLVPKAINDAQQALNALDWVIKEMTRRYDLFSQKHVRNFKEFNALPEVYKGEEDKLPYIVVVIDELADLMMLAGHELEEKIQRLTQLARAAGIHLIIATQRPSVNVITGVIKANLTSRIAFAVTDFASSKTILDQAGAEKLLGRGDMLYSPQDLPEPIRIQCPYVDSKEVLNITNFIRDNNPSDFDDNINEFIAKGDKNSSNNGSDSQDSSSWDPLLPVALLDFIQAGEGSASMIQRRHSVGYVRAGRIIDQMENAGFISPKDPAKQMRSVLITMEKYNEIFGEEE